MDDKIRIVIVDFDPILRQALLLVLEYAPHFVIVADVDGGLEALKSARHHGPDIVLMDASLPGSDAEVIIHRIKTSTSAKILVLSSQKDAFSMRKAMEAGADGYCSKYIGVTELLSAIEQVSAGERYIGSDIQTDSESSHMTDWAGFRAQYRLTPRELEILKMVVRGFKSREISEFLDISKNTIDKYRTNIMKKLGMRNVAELTNFVIRLGLIRQ